MIRPYYEWWEPPFFGGWYVRITYYPTRIKWLVVNKGICVSSFDE